MEIYLLFGVYVFFVIYLWVFYLFLMKENRKRKNINMFHNAIMSVYERNNSTNLYVGKDIIEQITLNHNKIFRSDKIKLLDMIEQLIFYYDSYSDERFKKLLHTDKNIIIIEFLLSVRDFIKQSTPFSSLPVKEASLLKNIDDAITQNNVQLGQTAVEQLSEEILNKETLIKKQEKQNQQATMLTIIGVVLTIFFGIISIF